jgi:hypothetical protein
MSDWEDDDGDDFVVQANDSFSDEEEEDETLAELAQEKLQAQEKAKEGKPKKTFDEIMLERKAKDAQRQLDEQKQEQDERQLTPEEQLEKMRDGLKAAEEADNRLMNELLGVETGQDQKVEEDPEALEKITMAISQLTLSTSADYGALSSALIGKLRTSDGEAAVNLSGFLETLLSEVVTVQLGDQLDSIEEAINAAKSTAEALEAAKPKVEVAEESKKEQPNKKKTTPGAQPAKGGDKLYGMFEDVGGEDVDEDDDSDEDSDEEEEEDFM